MFDVMPRGFMWCMRSHDGADWLELHHGLIEDFGLLAWELRSLQRFEVLRDLAQIRLGIVRAPRRPSELLALDLGEAKSHQSVRWTSSIGIAGRHHSVRPAKSIGAQRAAKA